jgi:hypothetical protein
VELSSAYILRQRLSFERHLVFSLIAHMQSLRCHIILLNCVEAVFKST